MLRKGDFAGRVGSVVDVLETRVYCESLCVSGVRGTIRTSLEPRSAVDPSPTGVGSIQDDEVQPIQTFLRFPTSERVRNSSIRMIEQG
jgi:hypothetical protein